MKSVQVSTGTVVGLVMVVVLSCADISKGESTTDEEGRQVPVFLSAEHIAAVNRPRRIIANNDVGAPLESFGMDINKWMEINFSLFDEPGSQVDGVVWCLDEGNIAAYPSEVIPVLQYPGLQKWLAEGIDIVKVIIEETHKRDMEVFWAYRLNGRDMKADFSGAESSPMKLAHPDWMLDSRHWNFAVPGVRAHKVAILRELATNYDFDGIDIDFSRTPPSLPVGSQWLHRDAMTDFMRKLRAAFQEVAQERGRPVLLSARLPSTVAGCHYDGLDIETWAEENLLDIIYMGSRSIDIDIAGYRRVIGERNIKLLPSLDEYHTTDGYKHPPPEVLRGFYANWWHQGIDGVQTFNWFNRTPAVAQKYGLTHPPPPCQVQGNLEIGSPATLRFKDKTFVIQRRYGELGTTWNYYQNINARAPLPAMLPTDGLPVILTLYVADDVSGNAERIDSVELHVLLSGAAAENVVAVKLNGVLLPAPTVQDDGWRIFTPSARAFAVGENLVSARAAAAQSPISIEKLEVHVAYTE